jgi:phosphatidate cytidylyltransferase
MRLGVIWFVALVAALALGPVALGVLCGLVAGVGGMQVAKSWHRRRQPVSVVAAGVGAAALPIAAAWGGRALGLALLAAVFGSVVVAAAASSEKPVLAAAGWTVRSWLFVGGPAASLVLLTDYDLGAAVSLVVLMSAYDAGDYVVGSGARTSWEGPVGGLAATVVLTLSLYVVNVSPFHGGPVIVYGVVFAVLAPLGQLAASAVLPAPDEIASGLRRFDSILLGGPVWAGLMAAGFAL